MKKLIISRSMVNIVNRVIELVGNFSLNWQHGTNGRPRNIVHMIAKLKQILNAKKQPLFFKMSYAQEGEDMLLSRIFGDRASGFYVDVGAHHPEKFSNTYYFYLQGWRGINIDAMPGSMEGFRLKRPEDINLEFAVSDRRQKITFYKFNEPAFNTFSTELANDRLKNRDIRLIETIEIETRTLSEILDEYLPEGREFELLNTDVEGLDLKVLKSNNWSKYRPKVVVAEYLERQPLENLMDSEIVRYMKGQGYGLYSKTDNSLFFIDHGYLNK